MKFQDSLFNWVQIEIVASHRPDDGAARQTADFFAEMLREDHGVADFCITRTDDTMVHVQYVKDGTKKTQMFDREMAWQLLSDINANPKYNNS